MKCLRYVENWNGIGGEWEDCPIGFGIFEEAIQDFCDSNFHDGSYLKTGDYHVFLDRMIGISDTITEDFSTIIKDIVLTYYNERVHVEVVTPALSIQGYEALRGMQFLTNLCDELNFVPYSDGIAFELVFTQHFGNVLDIYRG